jgi:hypothetical protein
MDTTTVTLNTWGTPERIQVKEYPDRIEMIYKETSMLTYTIHPSPPPEERVFKIIFSCKDGKWNKSEPIYGEIIPAQEEYYEFEE